MRGESQVILTIVQRRLNVDFVYKIERNGCRSKYYVIRKFLRHKQPQNFHIEDSNLGIVSNLLSYPGRDRLL